MIVLKTQSELKTMMKAMRISAETLNIAEETIREGITTKELDKAMYRFYYPQRRETQLPRTLRIPGNGVYLGQ